MITEVDIADVKLHLLEVIHGMKVTPATLAPLLGCAHVTLYRYNQGHQTIPGHLARWIATFAAADRAEPGIVLWACEHVELAGRSAVPLAVFRILAALFSPPATSVPSDGK